MVRPIHHIGDFSSRRKITISALEGCHHTGDGHGMKNRIKEHRDRKGWTQDELAERTGTTYQQISRLERGERRLTVEWLGILSRALGIPKAALLYEDSGAVSCVLPRDCESPQGSEEVSLLSAWRSLGEDDRTTILRWVERIARSSRKGDNVGNAA